MSSSYDKNITENPLYWEGVEFANNLKPHINLTQASRLSRLLAGEDISGFNKLICSIVGNNNLQADKQQALSMCWLVGFQDTFFED